MTSTTGFLNPAGNSYRFIGLIFISAITFGSYFAYDIIGAIAPRLIEEMGADRSTVGFFYTAYSISAIIAVLISGFVIDYLGTRKASLIFSAIVVLGSVIIALSDSVTGLIAGRLVFGAGAEPLVVVQSAMLARWFKGKELALSFGVALTISRLGTMFSFNTGELIASEFGGAYFALFAAALFCVMSLVSNLIYMFMDARAEKVLNLKEEGAGDKIVISEVKHFGSSFWYIAILCVLFYSAVFPFTALSTDFFVDKYGYPRVADTDGSFISQVFSSFFHMFSTAGGMSSLIIFASMVFAPFAGTILDRVGKRASIMIVGSLLMIPAYLLLALTDMNPVFPMVLLGGAFVLVPAAMWPSIALIVKRDYTGTAFGITTFIQNIGLALFPFLNGYLRDSTHSYTASMLMFASLGVLGLVFSILLLKADKANGSVLEKP
ncbi:MAG: MFS transporter [Bacteroidetes bacterium]|nr:MFS transporter [Bacteroidota bacterium]